MVRDLNQWMRDTNRLCYSRQHMCTSYSPFDADAARQFTGRNVLHNVCVFDMGHSVWAPRFDHLPRERERSNDRQNAVDLHIMCVCRQSPLAPTARQCRRYVTFNCCIHFSSSQLQNSNQYFYRVKREVDGFFFSILFCARFKWAIGKACFMRCEESRSNRDGRI